MNSYVNELLIKYFDLLEQKQSVECQLKDLEKMYLRLLVKECNHSQTLCDNCWDLVSFLKTAKSGNTHAHIYNGKYICKKRALTYALTKASHDYRQQQLQNANTAETAGTQNVINDTNVSEILEKNI